MPHASATYSPAALCRLDVQLVAAIAAGRDWPRTVGACLATIAGGASLFGAAFGWWRAPAQSLFSAVKMPLLILAVTAFSSAINALLAQALGARLSFRQVFVCGLVGFAVTSALLGAVSPVTIFFALQAPPADGLAAMTSYRTLLLINTAAVGLCGLLGYVQLFRLLELLIGSARLAGRVLLSWILVTGLTGSELSWLFSPFLSRPDIPIPFFNPLAFSSNFFEYVFRAAFGGVDQFMP